MSNGFYRGMFRQINKNYNKMIPLDSHIEQTITEAEQANKIMLNNIRSQITRNPNLHTRSENVVMALLNTTNQSTLESLARHPNLHKMGDEIAIRLSNSGVSEVLMSLARHKNLHEMSKDVAENILESNNMFTIMILHGHKNLKDMPDNLAARVRKRLFQQSYPSIYT